MNTLFDSSGKNATEINDIENKLSCDFLEVTTGYKDWTGVPVLSGTNGVSPSNTVHPGVIGFTSSTSANSGYGIRSSLYQVYLSGGEKTTFIFRTAPVLATITRYLGFHDTATASNPSDGAYAKIVGTTLTGQTAKSGAISTTTSNFTVTPDTWYRLVIQVNSDATLVTFTLYADNSSVVLWSDTLATNIPNTSSNYFGHGDVATSSGTTAINVGSLDYLDVVFANARRVV